MTLIPALSEMDLVSLSNDQSTISSLYSVSEVGNMWLRNDLNDVNKMIEFLKSPTLGKNNKNGSPAITRNSNKQFIVKNYDNKLIECLQSPLCVPSKILSEMEKLKNKHEKCGDNPPHTTFASVTGPINTAITIPNKATVQKQEVKIDQVEQDALSKTIVIQGVFIDSLLENNLQDTKYNLPFSK